MSCAPARLFGLPGGSLAKGVAADVTIFDPAVTWQVRPEEFNSKGRNTPYSGMALTGRAVATIVGGNIVFDASEGNSNARRVRASSGN
jgi:dihydroorotase